MGVTLISPTGGAVPQLDLATRLEIAGVAEHCAAAAGIPADELLAAVLPQVTDVNSGTRLMVACDLRHWRAAALVAQADALGAQVWVLESFCAPTAVQLLDAERVTHSDWLPWQLAALLALPAQTRASYRATAHRVAWTGGCRTPAAVKRAMIRWWGPMLNEHFCGWDWPGYCAISAADWLLHPDTVGRWIGSTDQHGKVNPLVALDDAGEPRATGQIGQLGLVVDQQTPWRSSEMGYIDSDDRVHPLGLAGNRLSVSFGRDESGHLMPGEAERRLEEHDEVQEAALLAINAEDGAALGLSACFYAVVELHKGLGAGTPLLEVELLAFVRRGLSDIKCPEAVLFVETLPRLASGQVDLAALGPLVAQSLAVAVP